MANKANVGFTHSGIVRLRVLRTLNVIGKVARRLWDARKHREKIGSRRIAGLEAETDQTIGPWGKGLGAGSEYTTLRSPRGMKVVFIEKPH
jgi:hypothetical protein